MSNKGDKQLKELQRLMPWNWDSRIQMHPPGEKAMHDFEGVVKYQYAQPRLRNLKPGTSAAPPPAAPPKRAPAKAKDTARLSVDQPTTHQDQSAGQPHNSNAATAGARDAAERESPPSTARHPAPALSPPLPTEQQLDQAPVGGVRTAQKQHLTPSQGAQATPAVALRCNPGCQLPPTRPSFTPSSIHPSSSRASGPASRSNAALADGNFMPTPFSPAPATLVAAPSRTAGSRAPPPRTVFASKKRGAPSEAAPSTARQVTASPTTNSTAAAGAHAGSTDPKRQCLQPQPQPQAQGAQRLLPAVPQATVKGPRDTATRPAKMPIALPFMDAAAAPFHKQPTKAVARAAAPARPASRQPLPNPAPASVPRTINLAKFGTGPVIKRPSACPPLFKPAPAKSAAPVHAFPTGKENWGVAPGGAGARRIPRPAAHAGGRVGHWGAAGHTQQGGAPQLQWQAPQPLSAWKRQQTEAVSAQLLARERGLMALVGGRAGMPQGQMQGQGQLQGGMLKAPPASLAALGPPPRPVQLTVEPLQIGAALTWACSQLQARQ